MTRPRLLYLVTEDSYFWSHRLPLARAARDAGCEVLVAARLRRHGERIAAEGFKVVPVDLTRSGMNPLREARSAGRLLSLYKELRPDLIHHVALKPVLYGTWAARRAGVPAVVNAVAGTGYLYSSASLKARLLRVPVRLALRRLLKGGGQRVVVQNKEDFAVLERGVGCPRASLALVPGSGVSLSEFPCLPEPDGEPRVVMVSRMLWPKGVGVFVEAARRVRAMGVKARFILVGEPDAGNPEFVPEDRLRAWHDEGVVEWRGRSADVAAVWASSHVAVLPSHYGEGVPKCLLEAAACGRAIVTTDAPGCRDVVVHGENGLLVPVKDPEALAEAVACLVREPELRRRMGLAGRARVSALFSEELIVRMTLDLYRELLGSRWPGGA